MSIKEFLVNVIYEIPGSVLAFLTAWLLYLLTAKRKKKESATDLVNYFKGIKTAIIEGVPKFKSQTDVEINRLTGGLSFIVKPEKKSPQPLYLLDALELKELHAAFNTLKPDNLESFQLEVKRLYNFRDLHNSYYSNRDLYHQDLERLMVTWQRALNTSINTIALEHDLQKSQTAVDLFFERLFGIWKGDASYSDDLKAYQEQVLDPILDLAASDNADQTDESMTNKHIILSNISDMRQSILDLEILNERFLETVEHIHNRLDEFTND